MQNSPDVYLITNGSKTHVSYETFITRGYSFSDVINVSPSILARFSAGPETSDSTNVRLFAGQWTHFKNDSTIPLTFIEAADASTRVPISTAISTGWVYPTVYEWIGDTWVQHDIQTMRVLPGNHYFAWAFRTIDLIFASSTDITQGTSDECLNGLWIELPGRQFTWEFEVQRTVLTIRRTDGFVSGTFQKSGGYWTGPLTWDNGDQWQNVTLEATCTTVSTNLSWDYGR